METRDEVNTEPTSRRQGQRLIPTQRWHIPRERLGHMTCDFADEPTGTVSVRRLIFRNGDGSAGASATGSRRRFPSACPQVISTCAHVETNCAHLIQGPIFLIPNARHLIHGRRLSLASLSRPVSTCPQLISNCAHLIQNPKKTIHKPGFPIPANGVAVVTTVWHR